MRFPLKANGLDGQDGRLAQRVVDRRPEHPGRADEERALRAHVELQRRQPSYLYAGARKTPLRKTEWSLSGAEDLFLVGSNDRLYTLTEFEDSRRVFAVDASDHGL